MATNFPTSADDATTVGGDSLPAAGTALSDSTAGHPSHSDLHENVGDAVQAVEAKIGTGSSTPAANTVLTGTGSGTSGWATVDTAMISADAVTGAKIADDTINSEHYAAGSIDREHLAADIVDGTKIADESIDSEHYVDGSIDTEHLADDAVTAAKIHDDAVTKVVVADTTDTSCSVALFESATGSLPPKTDGGLTYNAGTGTLTATAVTATDVTATNLTGELQTAAQANITSVGTLTGLTTSGTVGANIVSVDDGSATDPSFTFTSDTGNGMYLSGTDEVAFTTGGSQRVKITAGGTLQWIGSSAIGGPLTDTSTTTGFRYVLQNQTFGTLQDFTSIRARKEQITNVTAADSGQWIDALQPVTFIERWLGEGDEPADNRTYREADVQVGFIADDVLSNSDTSLFAQATDNGEGGLDPAGWKWECVIAAAVAELKSVRARLAALEG